MNSTITSNYSKRLTKGTASELQKLSFIKLSTYLCPSIKDAFDRMLTNNVKKFQEQSAKNDIRLHLEK